MWLQGKTGNARVSHVSLARTKGNESLTLLVSGDHGVTEYEVAPKEEGQTAPRKRREIGATVCSETLFPSLFLLLTAFSLDF